MRAALQRNQDSSSNNKHNFDNNNQFRRLVISVNSNNNSSNSSISDLIALGCSNVSAADAAAAAAVDAAAERSEDEDALLNFKGHAFFVFTILSATTALHLALPRLCCYGKDTMCCGSVVNRLRKKAIVLVRTGTVICTLSLTHSVHTQHIHTQHTHTS
jgi:hypothetical protein